MTVLALGLTGFLLGRQLSKRRYGPPPGGGSSRLKNPYRSIAAALILLALAGCAEAVSGQGHIPASSDSRDSGANIRGGSGM
jgi:hypothetical protein